MPYVHFQPQTDLVLDELFEMSPFFLSPLAPFSLFSNPQQPCNLARMYILNPIQQKNRCAVPLADMACPLENRVGV